MKDQIKRAPISVGPQDTTLFWTVLAVAVVLTVIGVMLGNPFEDYQTASTL